MLRNSSRAGAVLAKVNGEKVEKHNIGERIAAAMEQAVRDSSAQASAAGFSKTVVEVELHEPDLPDLTLLDLPGIVNSGGSKDFVKELVQEHINGIIFPIIVFGSL